MFVYRFPSSKRQFVSGLTQADFVVLENGRRQKVTYFTDEKNSPPIYVGLLLDNAPSTQGKMNFSKEAAKNFIYSVTRRQKDKASFMTFDSQITLWQDFTTNIDLLDTAIDRFKETGQQTSLYDAIYRMCDERMRNASGRRVIVVISDGKDTFSRTKLKEVIDIAQRTETVIFIVSTNNSNAGTIQNIKAGTVKVTDDKALLQLTAETGGTMYFVSDMLNLERRLAKILKEIYSQYIITYSPRNQKYDGKVRKIEVRFANRKQKKDYKIRTKTKYRAVKVSTK